MTATIEPGWHLYAQEAGEGPVPTSFKFSKNPLVVTTGRVKEDGKLHKAFDKNFDSELKYYENQVNFVQTVTVKGKAATKVKGSVEFMVCDDHQCLPPKEIEFAIGVGGK
jgi:thiol:disulfide interchange protein DsbD